MNISKVIGQQYKHTFKEFETFMQVLEVYGCGYSDDIHEKKYKKRDTESHR